MSEESSTNYRLGDWLVEAGLNRLSGTSRSVQLEPKNMDVLVYLCEHPGDVVSADELIEAVWAGRPMGDNPVYKSIAKLRRALGDDANEPRYIATVAKRGYRLVAEVARVEPDSGSYGEPVSGQSRVRRFIPVAIGMLAGVAVAAAVFWSPEPSPLELQAVTGFRGSHSQPSFSPDGEAIAFVDETDRAAGIWILRLGEAAPTPLTSGLFYDSRPRWSPDGATILFMRQGSLWSVPVTGGDATEVVRSAYNPNWSRDGTRIVFERNYEVWTADADGGNQERVAGVPRKELPLAQRWPAFSPSGEEIAFLDAKFTPLADLWSVSLAGGVPKQLTFKPDFSSAPVWSPDGKHIIYSSRRGGSRTLWQVDVDAGSSQPLLTGSGDDDYPDISADGSRIVYSNRRERFAIVRSRPNEEAERMLLESRQMILGPNLSPDRQTISYFALANDGGIQVFVLPVAGGLPKQLTSDPLAAHAIPSWSGDGQQLYFYFTRDGASFAKVSTAGGVAEVVVPGWDWGVNNGASVSPDGTEIIYSRLTGQVPVQTLIRTVATGEERTFFATLEYPKWSRDGTHVIGSQYKDRRFPGDIAVCPLVGPECRVVAESARVPTWSADESEIYYVRGFGWSQELFATPADGSGVERKVMDMAPLFPLGPFYDVTADGDIIWVRYEQATSELWMSELPNR